MRRPALLALALIALAAPLPAEVRECLPRLVADLAASCAGPRAACLAARTCRLERGTRAAEGRCARGQTATTAAGARFAVASPRATACPSARPRPGEAGCRLHPTPPGHTGRSLAEPVPAPPTTLLASLAVVEDPHAARAGWREPDAPRPRAAPHDTPQAPRPPPARG